MNALIQSGNPFAAGSGGPHPKIACCLLKEQILPL